MTRRCLFPEEKSMNFLMQFSRLIDAISEAVGKVAIWLVLIVVLISAGKDGVYGTDDDINNFSTAR